MIADKVKAAIRREIAIGGWRPGVRIPSERELVARFGCARMTVHLALRELQDEGLVVRRLGSGTYVADLQPISSQLKVRDIREEIAGRGHRHDFRVLALAEVAIPAEIADALRAPGLKRAFHCRLLHRENDVPVQIEDRYVNPRVVPDFLSVDLAHDTPSAFLFARLPLTEADHAVEAILADAEQARLLGIRERDPVLMISRRTASMGRVSTIARLYHPGARFRLFDHFEA